MDRFDTNNPKIFDGCNYYLMYKINDEWKCVINTPFVLNYDGNYLYGQYLSSLWFKSEIETNSEMHIIIIKLPRRDSTICPQEIVTIEMLKNRLVEYENVAVNIDYNELEFVVAYKYYDVKRINEVCCHLKSKIENEDNISSLLETASYSEYDSVNDELSLKYEILYEDNSFNSEISDVTNNIIANEVTNIERPQLIRSDNSWNLYIKNKNNYKYFITSPVFKIKIS
tara:strand:- start:1513 stop:2193 length:681 start_codon:yes stop_codon:yes gene_type:complete